MDQAPDPSITLMLRTETRAEHEAIETNVRLKHLMADDLTIPDYIAVLVRLATFYGPVENGLAQWSARFPKALELDRRLGKTALLRQDLHTLAPDLAIGVDDAATPYGTFASIEEAWGCLYVVEGSTLGGQLIARNLKATIGVSADHGAAFHNPYGPLTGARWQVFKATLTQEVERGALDKQAIVVGARSAFKAMDMWLAANQ